MKIPQEKPFRMGERIMSGNLISKMHNLSSDTIDECYVTEPRKRIFMLFPTFFLFSSQCKYELCQFLFDDIFEYSEKKSADKKAAELTTSQRTPHFVQTVKEAITE